MENHLSPISEGAQQGANHQPRSIHGTNGIFSVLHLPSKINQIFWKYIIHGSYAELEIWETIYLYGLSINFYVHPYLGKWSNLTPWPFYWRWLEVTQPSKRSLNLTRHPGTPPQKLFFLVYVGGPNTFFSARCFFRCLGLSSFKGLSPLLSFAKKKTTSTLINQQGWPRPTIDTGWATHLFQNT